MTTRIVCPAPSEYDRFSTSIRLLKVRLLPAIFFDSLRVTRQLRLGTSQFSRKAVSLTSRLGLCSEKVRQYCFLFVVVSAAKN